MYEIICSLEWLEELDSVYISTDVRKEAHTQLEIPFDEKKQAQLIAMRDTEGELDGEFESIDGDENQMDHFKRKRRVSAAGEALKALTIEEEIDMYKSAATVAANSESATHGSSDNKRLDDVSDGTDDRKEKSGGSELQSSSDDSQRDIIAAAVADAELVVKETANRIIHASQMRLVALGNVQDEDFGLGLPSE